MVEQSKAQVVALIGDVGGTNVRVELRRLCLKKRVAVEVLQKAQYNSQELASFDDVIIRLLTDIEIGSERWPTVCIIGISGCVSDNVVRSHSLSKWGLIDGKKTCEKFQFKFFEFINDFTAAGLGLCSIKDENLISLTTGVEPVESAPKIIIGPGTGLGEGLLVKSRFAPCYEVLASEGALDNFRGTSREDIQLIEFAKKFLVESKNIENQRHDQEPELITTNHLCSGPGIPLIYEFFKSQDQAQDLPRLLEEGPDGKHPDEITSSDIVIAAIESFDPLCQAVIDKFTQILANEVANFALKTLPFGGVYLVGGVTAGIQNHLIKDKAFLNRIQNKGIMTETMRQIPILIVKPEVELGLIGAQEQAFRLLNCFL